MINTIGKLIDHGMGAFLWCDACGSRNIDLQKLAEYVGRERVFVGRRWPMKYAVCDSRDVQVLIAALTPNSHARTRTTASCSSRARNTGEQRIAHYRRFALAERELKFPCFADPDNPGDYLRWLHSGSGARAVSRVGEGTERQQ